MPRLVNFLHSLSAGLVPAGIELQQIKSHPSGWFFLIQIFLITQQSPKKFSKFFLPVAHHELLGLIRAIDQDLPNSFV